MARKKTRFKNKYRFILGITLSTLLGVFALMLTAASSGLGFWDNIQSIANPNIRTVKIDPGMRKEEVAARFGRTLTWTKEEKETFLDLHAKANNMQAEGYFLPATYIVSIKAKPQEVSAVIQQKFKERILDTYNKLSSNTISLETAIKIASIIEREAGSKNDMKIISGVIWNRLFRGMSLDMDATLQYMKGKEGGWWPAVASDDKFTDSYYNTYKYDGLPPGAISNPSETAIWAAFNPPRSDILFYVHDPRGRIHTARTYKEHLANINAVFHRY